MSPQETKEAVAAIAETLTTHPSVREAEWNALSLVACRRAKKDRAHRMYGYLYLADGTITDLQIDFMALRSLYSDLIAATVPDDQAGWQKCLLQLGGTGRSNLQFEYEDSDRWTPNPADLDALPADLRPDFETP